MSERRAMYRALMTALCALALCGCDDPGPARAADQGVPDQGMADQDAPDLIEDMAVAGLPTRWRVMVPGQVEEAVSWAASDVVTYLGQMGVEATREEASGEVACAAGEGRVVFVGEGLGSATLVRPTNQTWRWAQERCEGGVVVRLEGGGLLGRQYAAYAWLHAAGVRFFHPEQEYVPATLTLPSADEAQHTPDFTWRSVSLHLTHPLELGDVFRLDKPEYAQEGKRYIDWQIKNFSSGGQNGWGSGEWADYGTRRGFPRSTGFSLHNQQQGGQSIIDPDDPRSEEDQIAAAIDARMGDDPDNYPEFFDFTFNPSEFSEIDDQDAVRQLTFIANYIAQRYPKTLVQTINHGTAGQPTEHYGVRFYDLPKFAPPNLGVKVHTLMFYDLFRPTPMIYGNSSFNFLYDFMAEQYTTRRLWHFPESAWWLTFDNGIPVYLPITLEARDRDIQGIAYMLSGKLDGHHVFGTGHEWGYWQNEYCSLRMSEDIRYRYTDCIDDITAPMGEAGQGVARLLSEVIRLQERDFIYTDILAYLVGTDDETEIAESVGVSFHPLPPSPRAIMGWSLDEAQRWEARQGKGLERMAADYEGFVARLEAMRPTVRPAALPWFDEIVDGIEITGLRARHARQVYGALVSLRLSQLTLNPALKAQAEAALDEAEASTERARAVVARREAQYRYMPVSRAIAGGESGEEDENWTVYGYRVHNRAHHVFYYTRIDRLAREAFEGSGEVVEIVDTVLGPGQQLVLDVKAQDWSQVSVALGDGASEPGPHVEHSYAQPGVYTVRVSAQQAGQPVSYEVAIAVVEREQNLGFSGKILQPSRAKIIEPVMPGLVVGELPGRRLALGFSARETGEVPAGLWTPLALATTGEATEPARLVVPVVDKRNAKVSTSLLVEGGTWAHPADSEDHFVRGDLATQAIIDAIVAIGGFEPVGARRLVAQTLGFTPDTLPVTVPFEVRYQTPMMP
jgi:hypothetical protein